MHFLGTALAQLNCLNKAMVEFQAAHKILPDNKGIQNNIKNLQVLLENETDSEEDYTE